MVWNSVLTLKVFYCLPPEHFNFFGLTLACDIFLARFKTRAERAARRGRPARSTPLVLNNRGRERPTHGFARSYMLQYTVPFPQFPSHRQKSISSP